MVLSDKILSHISAARRLVFVSANGINKKAMHRNMGASWPMTPVGMCSLGFFITKSGYAVQYTCSCLQNYLEDREESQCLMYDDKGHQKFCAGRPVVRKSLIGRKVKLIRMGKTKGYLFKCDLSDDDQREINPVLRKSSLEKGEPVFCIGSNESQWTISQGSISLVNKVTGIISTDIDCFHGFCGSALIDLDGRICGMGASIPPHDTSLGSYPKRYYGKSYFDTIGKMVESIGPKSYPLNWG